MGRHAIVALFTAIALALAAIPIYLLSMQLRPTSEPNASSTLDGWSNLRDWMSALSGWFAGAVAVAVAVATIHSISRQIAATNANHQELMRLQAHETMVLAKIVQRGASDTLGAIRQVQASIFNIDGPVTDERLTALERGYTHALERIILSDLTTNAKKFLGTIPISGTFEEEIRICREAVSAVRANRFDPDDPSARIANIRQRSGCLILLERELSHIESEARDFIKRWSHLAS